MTGDIAEQNICNNSTDTEKGSIYVIVISTKIKPDFYSDSCRKSIFRTPGTIVPTNSLLTVY